MKKYLGILIVSMISVMPALWGLDWTMHRASIDGAGKTQEVAYQALTYQWSYDTFSPITASPIVAHDMVFVGNHVGQFYAITAYNTSPDVVWQFETEGRIDSTACYYDGMVFFGCRDGYMYAVNADNGSLVWSKNLSTTILSNPIVYNGRLYIGEGAASNNTIIIDALTGQPIDTVSATQPVQSTPAIYDDTLFVTANDGKVYAYDINTLTEDWNYPSNGSYEKSSPVITADGVFVSPGYDERKMYKLNKSNGSKTDETDTITDISAVNRTSSPCFSDNRVFVSMCADTELVGSFFLPHLKLFSFDATDLSSKLWEYNFGTIDGEDTFGDPTLTQNCVYTTTFDGRLMAFKQSDGTVLYENSLTNESIESEAVISNGWVYVGLKNGSIKAYKAGTIVSIVSPRVYDVIDTTTSMKVSMNINASVGTLSSYTLSCGAGLDPDTWTTLITRYSSADQQSIMNWYPSITDGTYTLKLTAATQSSTGLNLESRVPITVNLPPAKPTSLSLTENTLSFTLNWTLSGDDSTGDNDVTLYRIYRSNTSGSYGSLLDSVSAGINTYSDTNIQANTQYYYIVRAYDGRNESSNSNEAYNIVVTETQWEQISNTTGGEVDLPDGTKVTFLPGTFDEPMYVRIKVKQQGEYTDPGNNLLMNGTSIVREFDILTNAQYNALVSLSETEQASLLKQYASSVSFNKPVTITIPYTVNQISGLEPSRLKIALWNTDASQWQVDNNSVANTDSQYVELSVTHFSLYRVVESPWVKITGSVGGSTTLSDGTQVTIPTGLFSEDTWVYIKTLSAGEYTASGISANFKSSGIARRFYLITTAQLNALANVSAGDIESTVKQYSSAYDFDGLVTIRIPYTADATSGMIAQKLRMIWFDESKNQWKIVNTSQVNVDGLYVEATVSHFSDYQIAEFVPTGDLLEKDKVYTYPNPAKGDTLTFKFYTGDDAYITIDVFNVAGEKVAHLAGEGEAGLVNTIEWDIKRYASGIYIYEVIAKQMTGNSKKKIIKKLAIIH